MAMRPPLSCVLLGSAAAMLLVGCSSGTGPVVRQSMTAPTAPTRTAPTAPGTTADRAPAAPVSATGLAETITQARLEIGRIIQAIDHQPTPDPLPGDEHLMRVAAAVEALQAHLEDYFTGQQQVSAAPLNDVADLHRLLQHATRTQHAITPLLADLQRLHEDLSTLDGPGARSLAARSAQHLRDTALQLNRELAQLQDGLYMTRPMLVAGVTP